MFFRVNVLVDFAVRGEGGGGVACLAASELSVLQKLRFLVFDALSFII